MDIGRFTKKHVLRAVSICDFILEGHSVKEASEEFGLCVQNVRRDIQIVGICSNMNQVFDTNLEPKDLRKKFILVQKTLSKLATENQKIARANRKTE